MKSSTLFFLLTFAFLFGIADFAEATHTSFLSGFAWSENIGWVSFNCKDLEPLPESGGKTCKSALDVDFNPAIHLYDYKVGINSSNNATGYAWSENIGWIRFDPPPDFTSGLYPTNPPADTYPVKYNPEPRRLEEWARACSATANGDCASATSDSWDGWIKTYGLNPDYQVSYNLSASEFEGWAWGGDVIGWISFNCNNDHDESVSGIQSVCSASDYKVKGIINTHPKATLLTETPYYYADQSQNFCAAPPRHILNWRFEDGEDCPNSPSNCPTTQTGYTLQISADGTFNSVDAEVSCTNGGCAETRNVQVAVSPGVGQIAYNKSYYWRVKVFDSGDADSGWITALFPEDQFSTALHLYPDSIFTYFPKKPSKEEEITFRSQAKCYDISNVEIACPGVAGNYKWDMEYNAPTMMGNVTGQEVKYTYNTMGSRNVAFEIIDAEGLTCRTTKLISPQFPLPKFKETAPSGMDKIRNYIASLMNKRVRL